MNVIEDGLTYFECISRSIGKCTGIQVHDTILYYFMKIVFSNAAYTNFQDFCENIKSNNTKHLKLNPQLVNNNAVKQWVKRFSHVEKSVATTPDVWFISYPKLLKGAMLRFFYWHRDYSNKPHRIYCKYVFSYLIADFYNCSVGIEVNNFGYIKDGKTYAGTIAHKDQIVTLAKPFKGYKTWHRYSDAQIESLRLWMHFIAERDGIDIRAGLPALVKEKGADAFLFNADAYYGKVKGVWTHTNTRKDKFDMFPQQELLDMLVSL